MLKYLCPGTIVNSLYEIDIQALRKNGIKGMILDLDNTIIPWDSSILGPEVLLWLESVLAFGMGIGLVSNNRQKRVGEIARILNVPYVARAFKPAKKGFLSIMGTMSLLPHEVAVVGDQLYTDVLGGNRLGSYTIWVKPLSTQEFIGTKVTRFIEKMTIELLQAKKLL
ncbi:YqeG family HAD IIIA-type phosphatase [Acetonema longum]|uniref:HAD superfamily (Subfamily IIIA) phosphatase, TIGR01668 n=1 Tax=Acetonema longum DSM 6540 TaxID=1009370 RepID=F7NPQ5_9FIRM|nr:YqeG family HAD IIIA-type phosphatase [Acetonema longum]EGO61896.1 hypothetical protein ALO_20512 [Acetonema longum DSM 6540]